MKIYYHSTVWDSLVVSFAHQGCLYLIKNKLNSNNVKYYCHLKQLFSI